MKTLAKNLAPHLIAIAIFLALVCTYFHASIFDGKTIQQADMQKVSGMAHELDEYYKNEGGKSAWTGAMFSGMPSYHIQVYGNPPDFRNYVETPVKALDYMGASMVLAALLSFYILMCVVGVRRWLAVAGSIAFAFGLYNFTLILVGHITKMYVIAFMPLTLAGMALLFNRKWLWGFLLFALGISLSLMNNHIQITYYLAIFCFLTFLVLSVQMLINKQIVSWTKISLLLLAGVVISILPSLGGLYANYEMGQESMRGPSDLTETAAGGEQKKSDGLDIDYAFSYSYQPGELLTLLVPNAYGGASVEVVDKNSEFYKTLVSLGANPGRNTSAPTYWGDQPFTAGPFYYGAIVCFLFVFGMFLVKNPLKWWIAGFSLIFVFMALGKHFSALNDFLFYHLPMYSKFRTPTMALVIPGMTLPLIGFWGLKRLVSGEADGRQAQRALIWSLAITGGLCLLLWIMPSLFLSFESEKDSQMITRMFQQNLPENILNQLLAGLTATRSAMASADAFRSLIFIVLAAGLIFFQIKTKNSATGTTVLGIGLLILITVDLWGIDKRYLNDNMFAKQKLIDSYKKTKADEFILQDKSPSFRVLNLTSDTFNETETSYFHKSIGGYHPAKLRRYQELIDHRIAGEMGEIYSALRSSNGVIDSIMPVFDKTPTLNMLNTKYIIVNPEYPPLVNPKAFGDAWFVDETQIAPNADAEIAALNVINPLKTAVIDEKFAEKATKQALQATDSTDYIRLTEYKPNILKYESNAASERVAVFSEIFYNHDWKASIDGQPADYYRADWTLRAMNVPAGKHRIEFRFEPDAYNLLNRIGSVVSLIFLLGLLAAVAWAAIKEVRKKEA
ncbi:MAG: YfhO family protein [Dysgonamonadaceae bacterium]|jgi:hypothetical protein|nr:YfhO family protein [Dysgonamonadaceae bacterium]